MVAAEASEQTAEIAEIAQTAGAKFYTAGFDGDYGRLKNFCLDRTGGRWVLFLRAGERIAEGKKADLIELLGNPNAEGYILSTENYPENYEIFSPVQSLRLIRKRREYRFQYKSFERAGGLESGIYDAFISIRCLDLASLSKELDRRAELLEREIRWKQDDAYLQYMYGVTLLNRQSLEEGITHLKNALERLDPDALYAPHLYKCLGWALISCGRYDEALTILSEGLAVYPFYTDLMVLRGELFRQTGKTEKALTEFKNCLQVMELPDLNVPRPEIRDSVVNEIIGEL